VSSATATAIAIRTPRAYRIAVVDFVTEPAPSPETADIMKSRIAFLSFSLSSLVFSFSLASSAAEKNDPPPEDGSKHLSGLEIAVRPTLGGAGADSPLVVAPGARVAGEIPSVLRGGAPYGTSFGAGAMLGYRFHPLVSAGLRGDFGSVSATDPSDGTRGLSRDWQSAGLYMRAFPLAWHDAIRKHVEPWVSAGGSYVHDGQTFARPARTTTGSTVSADWQLDSHSIGVPLGIGVDYRVTKAISVGPSFEYVIMNPIAGCAKQSAAGFQANRMCTDNEGGAALLAQASGAWNLGLSIRLTPF
jgi:hypothetical protein